MSADAGGPPEESGPVPGEAPGALDDVALYRLPLVALDFETTGLAAYRGDLVCEIGLVAAEGRQTEVLLSTFVDPGRPLSEKTKEITGIQDSDLAGAPRMTDVLPEMLELIGSAPLVMHNAPFDLHFLFKAVEDAGLAPLDNLAIDTLLMARFLDRNPDGNSLRATAKYHGINQGRAHRAADDALTTALAYDALVPYLELRGVRTFRQLVRRRLAGEARLFVARTSSVLLDLVGRAIDAGIVVDLVYAVRPGATPIQRRVRAQRLASERYLIGFDLDVEEERTYRLDRILCLSDSRMTYMSPWILPEEVPEALRR